MMGLFDWSIFMISALVFLGNNGLNAHSTAGDSDPIYMYVSSIISLVNCCTFLMLVYDYDGYILLTSYCEFAVI